MQTMLNRLVVCARSKHLTINTAKSEVVHFNSKCGAQVPTFKERCRRNTKRKKEKPRKQQKAPHINKGKGATWEESPFTRKEKGGSVRIRRIAGRQASRPLLIGLKVGRPLKRTSCLNKLTSIVHRMSMEFESKFLDSL